MARISLVLSRLPHLEIIVRFVAIARAGSLRVPTLLCHAPHCGQEPQKESHKNEQNDGAGVALAFVGVRGVVQRVSPTPK